MTVPPDLKRAKERHESWLLSIPGVTSVGIGRKVVNNQPTSRVAIRVTVKKKGDYDPRNKIPRIIDGHPTDVIEREYQVFIDTARYNPLLGGISGSPDRLINGDEITAGTIGALAKDRTTGGIMLLSNFHVFAGDTSASVGDPIIQPSLLDDGQPIQDEVATLSRWHLGGSVDCACAQINSERGYKPSINGISGDVQGTASAVLDQLVLKRGRTTGLTSGVVESVNMTVTTDYGGGIGLVTLSNQIGIAPTVNPLFADHGDSGSVVVNRSNQVIGLLYGGSSTGHGVANPIQLVLDQLNIDLLTGTPLPVPPVFTLQWPDQIPLPLVDGTTGSPLHPIIASPVTSGGDIERRLRFKGDAPVSLGVKWNLTIAEYSFFKSFFLTTLGMGTSIFSMPVRHPRTSQLTEWNTRFDGDFGAQFQEGIWTITARLFLLYPTALAPLAPRIGWSRFLVLPGQDQFITSDGFIFFVKS